MRTSHATLAAAIDHTLLKADATRPEIEKLCNEAVLHQFATVCIQPCWLELATKLLAGSSVLPIAVIGFPLGAQTTATKVFETQDAILRGAREIDMVIAVGHLKDGERDYVLNDIRSVVQAAGNTPVKVIIETGFLTDAQKITACQIAQEARAAFVKTSTGFGPGGATVADITLMRKTVGPAMGVKASGGVRTTADALKMLEAGATRIGASASVAIVQGLVPQPGDGY